MCWRRFHRQSAESEDGAVRWSRAQPASWVKGQKRYLDWERYVTGSVFIGLGVTAALAGGRKLS
jgi:threonine/homoserine/homoserine lactone efflux protein